MNINTLEDSIFPNMKDLQAVQYFAGEVIKDWLPEGASIEELREFRIDFDMFYREGGLWADIDVDENQLNVTDIMLLNAVRDLGSPLENLKDSVNMWMRRIFPS